jgi:hypothetical protein
MFFGILIKDQIAVAIWVYFWVFYSVALVFMSVFVSDRAVFVTMAL